MSQPVTRSCGYGDLSRAKFGRERFDTVVDLPEAPGADLSARTEFHLNWRSITIAFRCGHASARRLGFPFGPSAGRPASNCSRCRASEQLRAEKQPSKSLSLVQYAQSSNALRRTSESPRERSAPDRVHGSQPCTLLPFPGEFSSRQAWIRA
jgi:hypothetical protein